MNYCIMTLAKHPLLMYPHIKMLKGILLVCKRRIPVQFRFVLLERNGNSSSLSQLYFHTENETEGENNFYVIHIFH